MIESPIFAIFVFLLFPVFSSLFALHKGIYESWGRTVLFLLFFCALILADNGDRSFISGKILGD